MDCLTLMSSQSTHLFSFNLLKYRRKLHIFMSFHTSQKILKCVISWLRVQQTPCNFPFHNVAKKKQVKGIVEWNSPYQPLHSVSVDHTQGRVMGHPLHHSVLCFLISTAAVSWQLTSCCKLKKMPSSCWQQKVLDKSGARHFLSGDASASLQNAENLELPAGAGHTLKGCWHFSASKLI